MGGTEEEGVECDFSQNTRYTCLKFSNNGNNNQEGWLALRQADCVQSSSLLGTDQEGSFGLLDFGYKVEAL